MTEYEPQEFTVTIPIGRMTSIDWSMVEKVQWTRNGKIIATGTLGERVPYDPVGIATFDAPEPEDTDDARPCSKGDSEDTDDSERYYLTCDGISGLPCKEHGTDCRGRRTEDTDDVEPEPLKEGDWVLVWAQLKDGGLEPDSEGEVPLMVRRARTSAGILVGRNDTYVLPDAIVRPSAGQVPPWLKPVEEPQGIGAVVREGPDLWVLSRVGYANPWRAVTGDDSRTRSWVGFSTDVEVLSEGYIDGGAS